MSEKFEKILKEELVRWKRLIKWLAEERLASALMKERAAKTK